jgi:hypothetical protein
MNCCPYPVREVVQVNSLREFVPILLIIVSRQLIAEPFVIFVRVLSALLGVRLFVVRDVNYPYV